MAIAWLIVPPPAIAQAEASVTAGPLAEQVAGANYDAFYSPQRIDLIAKGLSSSLPNDWPPSWSPLIAEAVSEEAQANRASIIARLAPLFAARFSDAELAAGLAFLRARANAPADQPPRPDDAIAVQLSSTPAGRSFGQKYQALAPEMAASLKSTTGAWMAGVFRRFGEKAAKTVEMAPPNESEGMRADIACTLLPTDTMRAGLKASLQDGLRRFVSAFPDYPQWADMMAQAASDEIDASRAQYCRTLGAWIGKDMTLQELRATAAFLKTPAGEAFIKMSSGAMKPAALGASIGATIERFLASPTGQKLVVNLDPGGKNGGAAGHAYALSIMPAIFRRFGEAATAAAGR
jgi:hypothetical protein